MTFSNKEPVQTVIDECANISPEIVNCFVFNKNGEILVRNESTSEEQSKKLVLSFSHLTDHAHIIGGIQNLAVQGTESQLNIRAVNYNFLAAVYTRSADEKIVNSLTQVIIPTMIVLAYPNDNQIIVNKNSVETEPEPLLQQPVAEPSTVEEDIAPIEIPEVKQPEPKLPELTVETSVPKSLANQFMVEKISGLLVASDTVRIDQEVITKWHNAYSEKDIEEVKIENLEGKTTTCKFKPIKETNAKGIIQIPEKIMQNLQISKGKLVVVKPVVTHSKGKKH